MPSVAARTRRPDVFDRTDGLEALAGCGWVQAVDAGALEVEDGLSLAQHGLTKPVDKLL